MPTKHLLEKLKQGNRLDELNRGKIYIKIYLNDMGWDGMAWIHFTTVGTSCT
jgi:hypothetical protein